MNGLVFRYSAAAVCIDDLPSLCDEGLPSLGDEARLARLTENSSATLRA